MVLIIHWLFYIIYNYILTYTYNSDTAARVELRNSHWVVLQNFANFTGKHLCWSLFFKKLQAFRPATLLKRDSYTGVFLWNLRNSEEHLFWKQLNDCFCVLITSWYIDFYNPLQYTFSFYLYYAIKTIELMTREAVSFEEVFHWTKFLAFESQKFLSLKCFMKTWKNSLIAI